LLELLGVDEPADVEGMSHARNLLAPATATAPVRDHVYTEKTYHDSFDPIRAIRTKEFSYIENYARRPLLDLPMDIEESPSGKAVEPYIRGPRPQRELYDLLEDPRELTNLLAGEGIERAEAIADNLAERLHHWRQETGDVIPSEFAGTRISIRYTETYFYIHGRKPTSRSAIAAERGVEEEVGTKQ
jgi:arylsulfatase A-like enzyme